MLRARYLIEANPPGEWRKAPACPLFPPAGCSDGGERFAWGRSSLSLLAAYGLFLVVMDAVVGVLLNQLLLGQPRELMLGLAFFLTLTVVRADCDAEGFYPLSQHTVGIEVATVLLVALERL